MIRYLLAVSLVVIMTTKTYTKDKWVPFLQQTKAKPTVTLNSSTKDNVSFSIKINGMSVNDEMIGKNTYQKISIPDAEIMTQEGLPQVPVITKLIAIPDCDGVSISVNYSNELRFEKHNILPAPKYVKKNLQDGNEDYLLVYEENKSVYSSNADFPGKYGEILETGYVRGQKVARIAVYPVQFNPASKAIKAYTDFNISLTFINPSSSVNKELGIFRNMMHHTALNYELSGMSASTKLKGKASNGALSKATSGSYTRVTDLNLLVGANAMPVDYLIITHSSLFNSYSITNLANHRRVVNGYDVVIIHVDDMNGPPPNKDCVYEYYPRSTYHESIRDFIQDVYLNGKANHTGDGHLGYILLLGDAKLDDNSTDMLPAAYPPSNVPPYYTVLEQGGDYYYVCTGGDSDDLLDLMYGRLPAGNETELSNNVNKIISYEFNFNGSWCTDYTFISGSPDLFSYADPKIEELTKIVPPTYSKSYAYRAYNTSDSTLITEANPIFGQRFTKFEYDSNQTNLCGAKLLSDWLYNDPVAGLNNRIHTFIYEGHGGPVHFAAEGCGRPIFGLSDCIYPDNTIYNRLYNNLYSFMIFNCCETGYFDYSSGDCLAEAVVNLGNRGAIGVLASTRDSDVGGFGNTDKKVLEAMYNSLSHVMGEAIMESKLNMDRKYKRQFNLYGDPAVNLWPTSYTITEDLILTGTVQISENITVASGVTLTIEKGTTLRFDEGTSLIVNGKLIAQGTSSEPITFTSSKGTAVASWGSINFYGSSPSGSILQYCVIKNGTEIFAQNVPNIYIGNCTIQNMIYGVRFSGSSGMVCYCTISNPIIHGIVAENGSIAECYGNQITQAAMCGHGIIYNGGSYGYCWMNNISGFFYGAGTLWGSSPTFGHPSNTGVNNHITSCFAGMEIRESSYPVIGYPNDQTTFGNSIHNNIMWAINMNNCFDYPIYAQNVYWGTTDPIALSYLFRQNGYGIDYSNPLSSCPWLCGLSKSSPLASKSGQLQPVATSSNLSNIQSDFEDVLKKGIKLRNEGKYLEAKQFFKSAITKNPKSEVLYIELYKTQNDTTRDEIRQYLALLPAGAPPIAKLLLSYIQFKEGCFESAKQINNEIINENLDTKVSRQAKLNNFYIALYHEKKPKQASAILYDILNKSESSADVELSLAKQALDIYEGIISVKIDTAAKKNIKEVDECVPTEYELSQNYPNPFNPSTVINYQLPEQGHVSIKVYDLLGRVVETLVDEVKETGRYSVNFDGSKLSSGVYFLRMNIQPQEGEEIVQVKKMLLTK